MVPFVHRLAFPPVHRPLVICAAHGLIMESRCVKFLLCNFEKHGKSSGTSINLKIARFKYRGCVGRLSTTGVIVSGNASEPPSSSEEFLRVRPQILGVLATNLTGSMVRRVRERSLFEMLPNHRR